jgi:hypothetical protein
VWDGEKGVDNLREKQRLNMIKTSNKLMGYSIARVRQQMFQKSGLKVGAEPIESSVKDQRHMLSYVCKKEFGLDYKHCFFSRFLIKETSYLAQFGNRYFDLSL